MIMTSEKVNCDAGLRALLEGIFPFLTKTYWTFPKAVKIQRICLNINKDDRFKVHKVIQFDECEVGAPRAQP